MDCSQWNDNLNINNKNMKDKLRVLWLLMGLLMGGSATAYAESWEVTSGTTYESGSEYYFDGITLRFGEEGGAPFSQYSNGYVYSNVNGDSPGGCFYEFYPQADGDLSVDVRLNLLKPLYVTENGVPLTTFNGVTYPQRFEGNMTFTVYKNRTYRVYAAGSKLGFKGFNFEKFEADDANRCQLIIKAIGNGTVNFDGRNVSSSTRAFNVKKSTVLDLLLTPNEGCTIKSVKVNTLDYTSRVTSDNHFRQQIYANMTIEVEFAGGSSVTPQNKYTMAIISEGYGNVVYNDAKVRGGRKDFSVENGQSVTLTFEPDNNCRVKSVKVNGTDVTLQFRNNQYTFSITGNTTISVAFEVITHKLTISSTGFGNVVYSESVVRGGRKDFYVNNNSGAYIVFEPDNGCRLKSLKVNGVDVTSGVVNNHYLISKVTGDTTVDVVFEVATHKLTISSAGFGNVVYSEAVVRGGRRDFRVNDNGGAYLVFEPDNGCRLKSVKVNGVDVTDGVVSNHYLIRNVTSDTTVDVVFEVITYNLTINSSGYGNVVYSETVVRGGRKVFAVNSGTNAFIKFEPDNGCKVLSVRVNNRDVTYDVVNNHYTLSNITSDMTVDVVFDVANYKLTIKTSGFGNVWFAGNKIRKSWKVFTVENGANTTISFEPDDGIKVGTVMENGVDVTNAVISNSYTINNISRNTEIEVVFEPIPASSFTLTINSKGYGNVTYQGALIRGGHKSFTVEAGKSATLTLAPDANCRLKKLAVNNVDKTSSVSNNRFTLSNINANTTIDVEFEPIPVVTKQLTVKASGLGNAVYNGQNIRNTTQRFSLTENAPMEVQLNPDQGCRISSVKVNGNETAVQNNVFRVDRMTQDISLEVVFEEIPTTMIVYDGMEYTKLSSDERTVSLQNGANSGQVVIPQQVTDNMGRQWRVTGIESKAFSGNSRLITVTIPASVTTFGTNLFGGCQALAAIDWLPQIPLTDDILGDVSNPNLLVYVSAKSLAPSSVKNIVANGRADVITLSDATYSVNNFWCPRSFIASSISYTHDYRLTTGRGECLGWESIALPFTVQTIRHESKGTIVPYVTWNNSQQTKPFWLYEATTSGWKEAQKIEANKPYIISMPNNSSYASQYCLNGSVTFSAQGTVNVAASTSLPSVRHGDRVYTVSYLVESVPGSYLLSNDGSVFLSGYRTSRPFELKMTPQGAGSRLAYDIFEDGEMTGIVDVEMMRDGEHEFSAAPVYDLQGRRVLKAADGSHSKSQGLKKGLYIVNGKKTFVK